MNLCSFETREGIAIYDKPLACFQTCLRIAVFLYVVLVQMVMNGAHLKALEVRGVFRADVLSPTRDDCNPEDGDCPLDYRKTTSLPYCAQALEPYYGIKRPCEHTRPRLITFSDAQHIEIATRMIVSDSLRNCSSERTDDCAFKKLWKVRKVKDIYYADVERLIVVIYHSFSTPVKGVTGSSKSFNGSYEMCSAQGHECDIVPLRHTHLKRLDYYAQSYEKSNSTSASKLKQRKTSGAMESDGRVELSSSFLGQRAFGHRVGSPALPTFVLQPHASSERKDSGPVFDSELGMDVWPVRDILKLAHVNLDAVLTRTDRRNTSLRDMGTQIVLTIRYSNGQFGGDYPGLTILPFRSPVSSVEYTYSAQAVTDAVSYFDVTSDLDRNEATSGKRIRRSINIVVEITGEVLIWDTPSMAVFIGATVSLFSIADYVIRRYVLHRFSHDVKAKYKRDPADTSRLVEFQ
eukprot:TRINITY_DN58568_c0_g1_i1.p1 TRINITY_DN58568_c0_g1~~TRINITY_DN58568_c0_g1_i1.p1  ORF type:complete len:462 (+),score=12.85 TRINITY_DN58568_c0_g1_i1:68-1453(+)